MTIYDRVSVIVGTILVGIVLLLVLELPSRPFQFTPLGTPLTFDITGTFIVSLLLVGLSCAGTEAVMRTHPQVRRQVVRYTFPTWILPALTTMALALFLPNSPGLLYWLVGLVLGGAVLAWSILMHYQMLDVQSSLRPVGSSEPSVGPHLPSIGRSLIAYLLALIFFTFIYRTRLRSLVTATAVAFVASLIALSILDAEKRPLRTLALYAGIIGLVLGETMWALNYWRANVLSVGVLLMLIFYSLIGIAREHLRGTLTRSVVSEFLLVAALGVGVVILFGPR